MERHVPPFALLTGVRERNNGNTAGTKEKRRETFFIESDRLEEAGSKPGCNALALPPAAASRPAGGLFPEHPKRNFEVRTGGFVPIMTESRPFPPKQSEKTRGKSKLDGYKWELEHNIKPLEHSKGKLEYFISSIGRNDLFSTSGGRSDNFGNQLNKIKTPAVFGVHRFYAICNDRMCVSSILPHYFCNFPMRRIRAAVSR
jgi:hypothetical protein